MDRDDTLAQVLFQAIQQFCLSEFPKDEPQAWDDPSEVGEQARNMCRAGSDALEVAIKARA